MESQKCRKCTGCYSVSSNAKWRRATTNPTLRVGFDVTAVGRAQAGHNLCESRRCLAQSAVHSFRSRHRSGERETCTVVLLYMYDVETGHGCTGDIGMHMDVELDGRYCAHFSSNSSNALTADERQARILGE